MDKWGNGIPEEEVAKATPRNRHARNINEELHVLI